MAIAELDERKLAEVCQKHGIPRLMLFGSLPRGEVGPESDIDLIAELPRHMSLLNLIRLERELSDALGRKVDLLTEEAISPYIRQRIVDDLRVIYEAG